MRNSNPAQLNIPAGQKHNEQVDIRRIYLLGLLIITVCLIVTAVHWPCLSSAARGFDDSQYLYENELVTNPSWSSVGRFLSEILSPSTVGGYYHPLSMISLMLDYAMAGSVDDLRVFHRTSLTLHVMNTAFIIIFLYILFGNVWAAALVGLIFGIHPLTIEPICWISDRKTLLASFFSLLSLICYAAYCKRLKRRFYAGSLSFYILALMSKPTSIALPVMMILMDFWPLKRLKTKAIIEKLAFFIAGGLFAVITYVSHARRAVVVLPFEAGYFRVPLIMCHNIIFYMYKMVWPVNLSAHYPFPKQLSLSDPMILAGVLGTCLLIPALLLTLRKTRSVITGWLIFFVMLLPTMQLVGFTVLIIASDKFAYLPSVGILIILAFFLINILENRAKISKKHILLAVTIVLVVSGEIYATRRYLQKWWDSITLYDHMISITPNTAQPYNLKALALKQQGNTGQAKKYLHKALSLNPESFHANNNLGTLYADEGQFDKALIHLEKADQLSPNLAPSQMNLGNLYRLMGDSEEAKFYYKRALELKKDYVEVYDHLGVLLAEQGDVDEAIIHFKRALEIDQSYAQAYFHLGNAYQSKGQHEQAIEHFRKCLELRPNYAEAHNNLGLLLKINGRFEEAAEHYRQAITIRPNYARAYNNLGSLLLTTGKVDEAIEHFLKALELEPNYEKAGINLRLATEAKERTNPKVRP
ncbi:MAG: tetratricopeptide repeat protein [Planctomycetota bacterium]|jgi:tetratricopeptide (TPR) repeat protein